MQIPELLAKTAWSSILAAPMPACDSKPAAVPGSLQQHQRDWQGYRTRQRGQVARRAAVAVRRVPLALLRHSNVLRTT